MIRQTMRISSCDLLSTEPFLKEGSHHLKLLYGVKNYVIKTIIIGVSEKKGGGKTTPYKWLNLKTHS
jgi:hypothetical protein